MKRLFVLITILAAGSCLYSQQVVLTRRTHGLAPGSATEMNRSGYIDPGNAGKNQVWDLSGMGSEKISRSFVSPAGETGKNPAFPEASVILNEEGNQYFYDVDDDSQMAWGAMNACGRVVFKFRRPLINMRYPFTYGDEFSGTYEGTYYFSDSEAPLAGTYKVKADGYGKLILPGGKEVKNTLRVVFTHSYDVMPETGATTYDIIAYRWYISSERYPVAVIIGTRNSACNAENFSYRSLYRLPQQPEALAKSVTEAAAVQQPVMESMTEPLQDIIRIYPNPAGKQFTLEYTVNNDSRIYIELFDNTGNKIATLTDQFKKAGSYSEEFISARYNLEHGIYHIRSRIGDQSSSTTFIRE